MATLTVIWWRDIPAQVVARDGRRSSKEVLHPRFQVAIDKAASRAGKRAYGDYIERLEATYDKHHLAELIQSGGVEGGPAFPPAQDETPTRQAQG
jgi:hypothetical protein